MVTEENTSGVKFTSEDNTVLLTFHKEQEALTLISILEEYLNDQEVVYYYIFLIFKVFGNKLVLSTIEEFDYWKILKMAHNDTSAFFDNINSYIF